MPVSDSAVQIVINVTDSNSGEVISRIERSFSNLGSAGATTGKKVADGMKDIAAGAKAAGDASAKAGHDMEGHFQTAFDRVRLLRTELGVQMPRAMESVIARSQVLMGTISALGGVLVGIGAAGIIVNLGKEVYNLYEKWLDVGSAVEKYNQKAGEAAAQKFFQDSSLEDLNADLIKANQLLDQLNQKRDASGSKQFGGSIFQYIPAWVRDAGGIGGLAQMRDFNKPYAPFTMGDANKLNQAQGKSDADAGRKIEVDHRASLARIQDQKIVDDARLQGIAKIRAAEKTAYAEAAENRRYQVARENQLATVADRGLKSTDINYVTVRPDAGAAQQDVENKKAAAEADAQTFTLNREQAHELMQIRNEATNAMLRGAALYKAQEEQAIDELKYKDMDSMAAREAVHAKFHAEEMKRFEEQRDAVAKQARDANTAGFTGMAKIQAEGANRDQDIMDEAKKNGYQNLYLVQQERAINQQKTLAEMAAAEHSFSDEINMLADQSATHQVSGFAKIRADEAKQLDELKKKFDDTYGHMNMNAPGAAGIYAQGQSDLQRGQTAIRTGADQQSSDLARKNAEETAQIEAEARSKYLSAEKQKTAAIETEYEQRLQKYQEQLNQQEISYNDYNRRVQAAAEQRDAEMVQAATEARQKMASEFDSFFKGMNHPLQDLQNLGDKVAANAAATMVQKLQMKRTGTGMPSTQSGGILGEIFGVKVPGHSSAGVSSSTHDMGGAKMIALSSAQISVQSAQIALGGVGVSGGGSGAASGSAGLSSGWTGSGASFSSAGSTGFAGGAGSSSATAPAIAATGAGGVARSGSGVSGAMGDVNRGVDLFKSAKGIFGGNGSSSSGVQPFSAINGPNDPLGLGGGSSNSSTTASTSNGGMLNGGGFMSNVGGAATGALGLYSAYNSNGGVGGALGGAMSGMQLGMAVGGPVGAAVGAAAGAIMGAIGPGGAEKARVYYLKQVLPRITADQDAYNQGGMDYLSAYSDMQSLDMEAKKATNAMGFAGQQYYQNNIKPKLQQAEANFSREQQAGRSMYTSSAAQYAVGADSVPRDGFAFIHANERIMPSDQNERITRAIENGGNTMPVDSGSDGEVNLHFYAHDSKSAMQFLMNNKHVIRSAVNASYAENSGGSDV